MNATLPVAAPWFAVLRVAGDVVRIVEPHAHRLMRSNSFLVEGGERDLLIDTGLGVADLPSVLPRSPDKPLVVFTTHAHLDHIGGHHRFPDAEILVHPAEAEALARPEPANSLSFDQFGPAVRRKLQALGFDTNGPLLHAVPDTGFDVDGHRCRGVSVTRLVDDGDEIDLGNRRFDVLHLPGHSPGSIGLLERETGTLFAGDAIYDGVLIDDIPGASVPCYVATMRRLLSLRISVVHGGHNDAFGGARLTAIARGYLAGKAA